MEEQPNEPALKKHWLTETDVAVGLPGQAQLLAAGYRDSLLFCAFSISDQREALPPQQRYLGIETYDQGGDDSVSRGASSSPTLESCYHLSAETCVPANDENSLQHALYGAATVASLKAAVAVAETGVHGATATRPGAVANLWGAEATSGGNP
ncbi:hypothetical protein MRX96_013323 [Rhipicephalus microplus]